QVQQFLSEDRVYPHYYHPRNQWTALHFAAHCGYIDIVLQLLQAGFEPAAEGLCRETPYDIASCEGNSEDLTRLLSLLHFDGNFDYRNEMPGDSADDVPSFHCTSRRGSMSSEGYTPPFT
ncbi:hypothetical protein PFISCL1PPCAC_307, partial [Pristionchus fissidentatus]